MTQNPSSSDDEPPRLEVLQSDPSEEGYDKEPGYVVGIGASAGGLEALEALFETMPYYSNMAFVVIQHLSPDYKSMMPELLMRKTMIPVVVAEDGVRLEANVIYLLPPAKEMIVSNHCLYLTARENDEPLSLPINTFFRSLAEFYSERSIAIVLSGSGSDGSRAAPLVHDNGGFVIAQDPETCTFDSMPKSLIDTAKVDMVLAPEDIPQVLVKYSKRTTKVVEQMHGDALDAEETQFSEIIILLKNRFDLDFSLYKPSTITRRIERRLTFQKLTTLRSYMDVLLSNKDELNALYCDLLIGVTCFFRDEKAYQSLDHTLPQLFKSFPEKEELRIWVAACASGQEAYSMSILLHEALKREGYSQTYKIFATDMHQNSIEFASAGRFTRGDLKSLSKSHRKRYFDEVSEDCFQVVPLIRDPIVFAKHNILKDAPFTNMHVVSCRNLLIYFNVTAQERVLSLLTFSLRSKGILFLGSSETLGKHENDFKTIDVTHKLYRKVRETKGRFDPSILPKLRAATPQAKKQTTEERLSPKSKKALELLLQKYVPASVLVDAQGVILHIFGDVGKFLSLDFGAASLNIRSMVGPQAKATVSQMIVRVAKTGQSIESKNVRGFVNHEYVTVNVQALAESPNDREYLLVSLIPGNEPERLTEVVALANHSEESGDPSVLGENWAERFRELEEELQYTKESLQTTVEELESSNEELQATNEELMASNEEMQSTNEELQSVNEELFTVNAEFLEKERERNELAADEKSIVEASGIGIVFLDNHLNIRKFSDPGAKVFNLMGSDMGRSFKSMGGDMITKIMPDVDKVFSGVQLIEKDFESTAGPVYRVTITGYRLVDEMLVDNDHQGSPGVVITCFDVSKQRALRSNLEASEARFSRILNTISNGYVEWQYGEEYAFFTQEWLSTMGYAENPSIQQLFGDQLQGFQKRLVSSHETTLKLEQVLCMYKADGSASWFIFKGESVVVKIGAPPKLTGILIDFNRYKSVERKQQEQAINLERSNQLLEQFAHIVSHDLKAPLRHIQNYLKFLQQAIDKGDIEAMSREMEELFNNATLLEGLIDDIITFSRVNSERKKVEQVNLDNVIEAVKKMLSSVIREKNITLRCDKLITLPGDTSLYIHLFQNLISNACKYNDKAEPVIEVSGKTEENRYIIEVKDNGIGFDKNHSGDMFAPFKRLVTKDQYEGSGIGLSICKTVVELHGGHISAVSEQGKGSVFTVTLPLKSE